MLDYQRLQSFEQDEFRFLGAHAYFNDSQCFLLSLDGTSLIISKALLSELETGTISDDFAYKLFQRGFATAFNNKRYEDRLLEIRPSLFMIDFTTRCNCNCIYCLRHFENVGESISVKQLDKITDYIIAYCKKHGVFHISFQPWGGEPMIELNKIIHCKQRFDAAGIDAAFTIQTNGLLLNLDNYKKLKANGIHIGISIDGVAEVHDAHRVDVKGGKTHERIVNNIKAIMDSDDNCEIGALSVNSSYSLHHITEDVDYLVNELGISNIKLNLVHPSGSIKFDHSILISKEQIPEYVDLIIDAVIKQILDGKRCYESNIADKLCNLLGVPNENMCNSSGCRGGLSFVSFDREGNIYPCEMIGRTDMKLGNIEDDIDLIELIRKAYGTNPYYEPRKTQECEDCPFFYFCRGGCKACSLSYGKDAADIDEIECAINKAIYPRLVEIILEKPRLAEKLSDYKFILD